MEYVAGIDIGTGCCKTVLVDAEGRVAASATREYFPRVSPVLVDMNPMDWWDAACATLREACGGAGIKGENVRAVGCSGQMQGCTLIGADGGPVRNSLLWYDMAPKAEAEELLADHAPAYLRNSTILPTTAHTGSKLRWLMKHEPEAWEKTKTVLFASGFLAYMLTGTASADRSNIGLSGLNSIHDDSWAGELLDIVGVPPEKLPPLLRCDDIAGTVTRAAAEATGLREGTPVIAGCGDATAECFAVNIENRPEIKLRLGSAAAANALVPKSRLGTDVQRALPYNGASVSTGGYTKACALSVKWIRDVFFSELPREDGSYGVMDGEASAVPAGSGGVLYHPFLNGENCPYYDTNLRGKFTGIGIAARRGAFLRAAYEGVAFSIRDMIESDPVLRRMERLILCGGGTKSRVWLPVVVDVLGREAVVPESADAAFGVALMAGRAAGLFDAAAAAERSRERGAALRCDRERHALYSGIFTRYLELVRV